MLGGARGSLDEAESVMIIITIICHSNGQFSVGKNIGHGIRLFATRKAADARAMQLQAEAGGADNAKIIVHDLTR